jgi:hypothetical protein
LIKQINFNVKFVETGDKFIFGFEEPFNSIKVFKDIKFNFSDKNGKTLSNPEEIFNFEFRYSWDNNFFSTWIPLYKLYNINFTGKKFYLEIKILLKQNLSGELTLDSYEIDAETLNKDKPEVPPEKPNECISCGYYVDCTDTLVFGDQTIEIGEMNKIEPDDVQCFVDSWQTLNNFTNKMYGLDVSYFKVEPDAQSTDNILKQYGIYETVENQCIRVLTDSNEYPESRFNFNPFGIDFEGELELLIEYNYFQEVFGAGAQPNRHDFIYASLNNRLYEVTSVYLYRWLMLQPGWWKLSCKKYEERSNVKKPENVLDFLDEKTTGTEDVVEPEKTEEIEDVTNPKQQEIETFSKTIQRSAVEDNLVITNEHLINNYTTITQNVYQNYSVYNQFKAPVPVVEYEKQATLNQDQNLTFTTWFRLQELNKNYKPNEFPSDFINSISKNDGKIVVSLNKNHKFPVNGWIKLFGISNDYFEVINTDNKTLEVDTRNIDVNIPSDLTGTGIQQVIPSKLFGDINNKMGLEIYLFEQQIVKAFINNSEFTWDIGEKLLPEEQWYAMVFQIINDYEQLQLSLWRPSAYPDVKAREQSTELKQIYENTVEINKFSFSLESGWKLWSGPFWQTAIRLMKQPIEVEKQSTFLNYNTVKDAHLAWILDNAKPIYNLPKFGRNY